jgi:hypothetical protein
MNTSRIYMKILNIKEPYWSAWKAYGWEKGVAGIGISNEVIGEALKNKSDIYIYIGKDTTLYQIDPYKVLELSMKYHSKKTVGHGVSVKVIPINELEEIILSN